MIQINELRIGNYIEEGKVEKIDNSIDEIYYSGDRCYLSSYCNNINPITLTEEWLFKFGFELNGCNFELPNFRFHVNKPINYNGFVFCDGYTVITEKIQSVHQLQNLYFCLTGSELTVA